MARDLKTCMDGSTFFFFLLQHSTAQRSTAPPLVQHKVRYWAASRSQRSTASCVLPLAPAIGGDPIPDPGSRAAAGWRAQNSTTAGRALAV